MALLMMMFAFCLFVAAARAFADQEPLSNVFKVPLKRQHVPVVIDGQQVSVKTAYSGRIGLGGPLEQNFTVVFDTGSGHLFVPHVACAAPACKMHKKYDAQLSSTGVAINNDGSPPTLTRRDQVSIGYGKGWLRGPFVRDTICFGQNAGRSSIPNQKDPLPFNCVNARIITATLLSDEPFVDFAFDGVLGLGLRPMAVHPEFHIFDQLAKAKGISPMFGFFMSMSDAVDSEITFGGHDATRIQSPLVYVPVHDSKQGHWRVQIRSVRIGNETLAVCEDGSCTAVVDTGTSLLGVPAESYDIIIMETARKLTSDLIASSLDATERRASYIKSDGVDCRYVPGPSIVFDLGGHEIAVDAQDYSRPVPTDVEDPSVPDAKQSVCRASLFPIDFPTIGKGIFVFGAPVLKKYYTVYDLDAERVGFAKAFHPTSDMMHVHV